MLPCPDSTNGLDAFFEVMVDNYPRYAIHYRRGAAERFHLDALPALPARENWDGNENVQLVDRLDLVLRAADLDGWDEPRGGDRVTVAATGEVWTVRHELPFDFYDVGRKLFRVHCEKRPAGP